MIAMWSILVYAITVAGYAVIGSVASFDEAPGSTVFLYYAFLTVASIGLFSAVLLIFGLCVDSDVMMMPWIILWPINWFLDLICTIEQMVVYGIMGYAGYVILSLAIGAGILALDAYFWRVVHSEFENVRDKSARRNGGMVLNA